MSNECVFCKIAAGEFQTEFLAETEHSLAFRDIAPRQPVHILVIPKTHFENIGALAENDEDALQDLIQMGTRLAAKHTNGSFRFTFNTGAEAGQTVFHAHGHITSTAAKAN